MWVDEVTDIVFVYNPRATNYGRAVKWIDTIAARMKLKPERINIIEQRETFDRLMASLRPDQTVLLGIAGGDGTVGTVVNRLVQALPKQSPSKDAKDTAARLFLLPLWGGNANDMACMLNGLSSAMTTPHLLARSKPVAVPLIKLRLVEASTSPDGARNTNVNQSASGQEFGREDVSANAANAKAKIVYACCYAGFGASAYIARRLNAMELVRQKKIIHYFPPVLVLREVVMLLKAVASAPMFRARLDKTDTQLYDHTFINGPRYGKNGTMPIRLTEPLFLHMVVTKKYPSLIVELLRIATRRRSPILSTKSRHTFTVYDSIDAQIDGEIHPLKAGTKVSATIMWPPFLWVSTKFGQGKRG